jgi:hypothetical protein
MFEKKKTGDGKELHSAELHNIYTDTNIIRVTKSNIMRWVEYVARAK